MSPEGPERPHCPDGLQVGFPNNQLKNFVERPDLTNQITEGITAGSEYAGLPRSIAIWGPGGAGKTHLALHFARMARSSYNFIFWVDCQNTRQAIESYVSISRVLGIPRPLHRNDDYTLKTVKEWLETTECDWLMVIDNADDLPGIHQFIPSGQRGSLIMTSRDREVRRLVKRVVNVNQFSSKQSVELLYQSAGLPLTDGLDNGTLAEQYRNTLQHAELIVKELGCLPLAIDLAGAYISQNDYVKEDISLYLTFLQRDPTKLLETQGLRVDDEYHRTIANVWETSFDAIEQSWPESAQLLFLLAYMSSTNIDTNLFGEVSFVREFRLQAQRQETYSLSSIFYGVKEFLTPPADFAYRFWFKQLSIEIFVESILGGLFDLLTNIYIRILPWRPMLSPGMKDLAVVLLTLGDRLACGFCFYVLSNSSKITIYGSFTALNARAGLRRIAHVLTGLVRAPMLQVSWWYISLDFTRFEVIEFIRLHSRGTSFMESDSWNPARYRIEREIWKETEDLISRQTYESLSKAVYIRTMDLLQRAKYRDDSWDHWGFMAWHMSTSILTLIWVIVVLYGVSIPLSNAFARTNNQRLRSFRGFTFLVVHIFASRIHETAEAVLQRVIYSAPLFSLQDLRSVKGANQPSEIVDMYLATTVAGDWNPQPLSEALAPLVRYGLIRSEHGGFYRMHVLIRWWARSRPPLKLQEAWVSEAGKFLRDAVGTVGARERQNYASPSTFLSYRADLLLLSIVGMVIEGGRRPFRSPYLTGLLCDLKHYRRELDRYRK